MEAWEWVLVLLAGLSAVLVMGANLWAIFDVLRQDCLDQIARIMMLLWSSNCGLRGRLPGAELVQ